MKTTTNFVAAFAFLLLARQIAAAPIQWDVNDHYYDAMIGTITWPDAKIAAESQFYLGVRGHLVTISDANENAFVNATFHDEIRTDLDGLWAGFTDQVTEGEWRWIDDTPGIWQDPDNFADPLQTTFTDWNTNEPNDVGGEDFLTITAQHWNDFTSTATRVGYLIEWDFHAIQGDTNGDGMVDVTDINNVLNNFRLCELGGPPIPGDAFPFDGMVDLGDLNLVRNHFGSSADAMLVPELPTGITAFLTVVAVSDWRKLRYIRVAGTPRIAAARTVPPVWTRSRPSIFEFRENLPWAQALRCFVSG